VALAVTFLSCLAMQQLAVAPFPAEVGQPVVVRAERLEPPEGGPAAAGGRTPAPLPLVGLRVLVEQPDGARQDVGVTDAGGAVQFVPVQVGTHVFSAEVDGVRVVAPHRVVPAQPKWLPALVSVPLGLALLWRHLQRRAGRGAGRPAA
jgi:hypothetical protein